MTTSQSFGINDELLSYLSMRLRIVPELSSALEQVAMPDTRTKGQVYIIRPSILDNPDPFDQNYRLGAKVTYFDREGQNRQFGLIARMPHLQNQTLLEHTVEAMGRSLAEGILEYHEHNRPQPLLPTRPLTAQDREELCLPF